MDLTNAKNWFFDASGVMSKLDKAERKALSRQGAFIWRRAKSSLKYGKKTSSPGKPPTVHRRVGFTKTTVNKKTGASKTQSASPLRELIFFSYDPAKHSTVVGPTPFKGKAIVPGLMERGGVGRVQQTGTGKPPTVAYYRPRPFMAPAEAAERPKFAEAFKNAF